MELEAAWQEMGERYTADSPVDRYCDIAAAWQAIEAGEVNEHTDLFRTMWKVAEAIQALDVAVGLSEEAMARLEDKLIAAERRASFFAQMFIEERIRRRYHDFAQEIVSLASDREVDITSQIGMGRLLEALETFRE